MQQPTPRKLSQTLGRMAFWALAVVALTPHALSVFHSEFGLQRSAAFGFARQAAMAIAVAAFFGLIAITAFGAARATVFDLFKERPIAIFSSILGSLILCNTVSDVWHGGSMSLWEIAPIFLVAAAAVCT